jgi:hypothetical protein
MHVTGMIQGSFLDPSEQYPRELGRSIPIYSADLRRASLGSMPKDVTRAMKQIKRGTFTGDVSQILFQLGATQAEFQRAITSSITAFPVRENLEAEAKVLFPLDTPIRNMLPRVPGAGLAAKWKQLTSAGGGYFGATTVSGAQAAGITNIPVASSVGFNVNDQILIDTGANLEVRIVSSIPDTTHITVTVAVALAHANGVAIIKGGVQGGSNATGAVQFFYSETGAPAEHTSTYADQSASYKLMGVLGKVTGFAMAAGANFQNQLAIEKTNAIRNTMLNEENALLNASTADIQAPWGDGTNNWAFSGLVNLIATANGVPTNQIQSAVGGLTTAHIDAQLGRLWLQGAQLPFMIMNEQEIRSLAHLAEASGSIIRVNATSDGKVVLGVQITGYVHPITGEMVPIIASRFLSPGTILFGAKQLPMGGNALEVDVLPQVQLPQLAPNQNVQGYTAQEVAPSITAPQTYPFIVTVFEVLKLKSALHVGKSTGVTAV